MIHRDFKPENVLVGADGRARVADFGLARLTVEELTTASSSRAPAAASMTASGTVAGTPAYMSPEQKAGERLDARSDQYSFCVALFEALDGQRPDLDRRPPPQAARAPAHVRRALSRGLLGTPAERYPDMDALLGQLARDPRTTRRSAAALGALGVTALASVVALRSPAQPELLCRGGAAKLAGVWDEASRQAVRAAFATTGKPFAADAWSGVDHALTRNSAAWVAEWTQACEATHVRGEQSAATLDLRMECLDGQRQEMRGFIEILTSADAAVVQRAPLAAQSLLDVERCRRTEALRQLVRPPHNAVDTARVQALQLQLANAVALRKAAKYAAAAAATNEVLIGARALGYSPMVGEARFILAITQDDRGDLPGAVAGMREAAAVSEAGHDDHRRAEALAELVRVLAEQAHYDEADGYAVLAEAVISRAGGDEDLRVRLLKARGEVLEGRGKYDEAVTLCKQIVGLRERSAEARPAQLAVALLNLGEAYHLQGDRDESIATSKRALALFERELGKVHPTVGLVLNNIGAAYAEKNESVEALHYLQRALTLREAALGADNMEVATNAQNVGIVLVDLGQFEQARPLIEHTLELRQKLFGPTHPQVATSWWALALLQLKRGDPATALPLARRALDIRRQTLAADHAILALSLDQVAEAELGVGHAARALPLSEQAVAITERQHEMVPELALQRVSRAVGERGRPRARAEAGARRPCGVRRPRHAHAA